MPASASLDGVPGTVRATVTFVLADIRTGSILWRAVPQGDGATAAAAIEAAVLQIFPSESAP